MTEPAETKPYQVNLTPTRLSDDSFCIRRCLSNPEQVLIYLGPVGYRQDAKTLIDAIQAVSDIKAG